MSFASLSFTSLIIPMHAKEMQIIRRSLAVLFSSLMIVYIVLYQVKGEQRKNGLSEQIASTWDQETVLTYQNKETTKNEDEEKPVISSTPIKQTNSGTNKTWSIDLLSWTTLFYGKIDGVEKIGIDYDLSLIHI